MSKRLVETFLLADRTSNGFSTEISIDVSGLAYEENGAIYVTDLGSEMALSPDERERARAKIIEEYRVNARHYELVG